MPENSEGFLSALQDVIYQAHENGVGVERSWSCRSEIGGPDWEVEIVRLSDQD